MAGSGGSDRSIGMKSPTRFVPPPLSTIRVAGQGLVMNTLDYFYPSGTRL